MKKFFVMESRGNYGYFLERCYKEFREQVVIGYQDDSLCVLKKKIEEDYVCGITGRDPRMEWLFRYKNTPYISSSKYWVRTNNANNRLAFTHQGNSHTATEYHSIPRILDNFSKDKENESIVLRDSLFHHTCCRQTETHNIESINHNSILFLPNSTLNIYSNVPLIFKYACKYDMGIVIRSK